MKKLLIGLLALGSISSFAANIECVADSWKSLYLGSPVGVSKKDAYLAAVDLCLND